MKKIYTAFILVSFVFGVKAQLTLTKTANAPIVGYTESMKQFDSTTSVPKSVGTNKSWDFTSLTLLSGVGTVNYTTTSSTPSANLFPSANIATNDGGGSYHEFYNSQTNKLEDLGGVNTNDNSKTVFSNPVTWMVWPFSYGTFNSDAFAATQTSSTNVTMFTFSGNMNLSGTGTGTVTLPSGQKFNNCLQVTRSYTFLVAVPISMTFTSIDYEYWVSTYRSPIIVVSYQTVKQPTATTNQFDVRVNSFADVGIEENEIESSKLTIYPNPVRDKLTIILPDNAVAEEMELYDVSGKLVAVNKNVNSMNVSALNKGVYMLIVKHKDGRSQKRVVIGD